MSDASDSKPDNGEAVLAEHQAMKGDEVVDGVETATPPESDRAASSAPRRTGAGPWPMWLALLLSVVALALAGGLHWSDGSEPDLAPDPALTALDRRIDELQRSLSRSVDQAVDAVDAEAVRQLELRIASVEQAATRPDERMAALQQRLERTESELDRSLAAVRQRIAEAEQASRSRQERLEQLEQIEQQRVDQAREPGLSSGPANAANMALMRIEELLAAARDRLQLLGDVQTARKAWAEAIVRVEGLDAPEFDGLLQRLRAERDALAAVSIRDDAVEISALFAASNDVLLWPARRDSDAMEPGPEELDSRTDSGWRARFGRVFERLVRVDRVDIQYLDPAELDAARSSLAALFETMALTVARRDDEVTARLAAEAQRRIRELFETREPSISALMQRLGTLASPPATPELPLDASMNELRRLIEDTR
jgi:uncharacterized protein HemX